MRAYVQRLVTVTKKLNNDIHVKKIKILLKSFDLLNYYYTLVIED